jgi:hypothetical protein
VSGTDEGDKMSNVKVEVESHPWKNERYFSSFQEADNFRKELKVHDRSGTLQVKVKRSGVSGINFVVKSRTDPSLKAVLEEIEEKLLTSKNKKSSKKTK